MAAIEVSEQYPRCKRILQGDWDVGDTVLSLKEIQEQLRIGNQVFIYVDGWKEPWRCFNDINGVLRANCPTAPKVVPIVTYVGSRKVFYNDQTIRRTNHE